MAFKPSATFHLQVLQMLMQDPSLFVAYRTHIRPTIFDNITHIDISYCLFDFIDKHRSAPSIDTLRTMVESKLANSNQSASTRQEFLSEVAKVGTPLGAADFAFVQENFQEWLYSRALEAAVMSAVPLLNEGKNDEAAALIEEVKKNRPQPVTKKKWLSWDDEANLDYYIEPKLPPISTGFSALDEALNGGLRPREVAFIVAPSGRGKCFAKGTPVLMFDGSIKPVEEVIDGDLVMGPDSLPRRVFGCVSGTDQMYRVTPVKGDPYEVNSEHILSLKLTRDKGKPSSERRDISVKEFLTQNKTFKHRAKGWRTSVNWPERDVLIPPYIMGLWLGDGSCGTPCITDSEMETIWAWEEYGISLGLRPTLNSEKGEAYTISLSGENGIRNPVSEALRQYGIWREKSIPQDYLINSRQNRLELLAGLLDTDGHYSDHFEIVQKSKPMAEQILFLARSLGFAAYCRPTEKYCQTGGGGTYYRVTISGHLNLIPTRLAKKRATPRRQIKDVLVTGIDVQPIGEGEYYGFAVDGDHLFLLGDFTVVHNSMWLINFAAGALRQGKGVLFVTLELSDRVVLNRLYACMTGTKIDDFEHPAHLSVAKRDLRDFRAQLPDAKFWVVDRPRKSISMSAVHTIMEEIRDEEGFIPDLVCVDYVNLLRPVGVTQFDKDYQVQAAVSGDITSFAQTWAVPCWTAAQTNREGLGNKANTMGQIAGSYDQTHTADYIFLQSQVEEEEARGLRRLYADKSRSHRSNFSLFFQSEFDKAQIHQITKAQWAETGQKPVEDFNHARGTNNEIYAGSLKDMVGDAFKKSTKGQYQKPNGGITL